MKVIFQNVRLSYPHLFTEDKYGKHSCSLILDKVDNKKQIDDLNAAVKAEMLEKFGAKSVAMETALRADKQKCCIKDGDTFLTGQGEPLAPGCVVVSCNRKPTAAPLQLLDGKKVAITQDGILYAGCYVNASLEIWGQTGEYQGIRGTLNGLQFAGEGERFGGAPVPTSDDFEPLETGEEAGDFNDL